jgi:predicted  nucleic acid-binding Zn-ribbon protein
MEEAKIKLYQQFCDPNERLNKTCPKCGSNKISFLQYGLGWDDELQPLVDSLEIIPCGCLIGENNLACRDCEYGWDSVPLHISADLKSN